MGKTTKCEHEWVTEDVAANVCRGCGLDETTLRVSELLGERDVLRARLSAAERERDSAFARGVEAAAKAARGIAVMASGAKRGDSYKQGFCDGALGVATAIDALSPAPDAGKETTT